MKLKTLNLITLIALGTNLTYAQKLPNVQTASLRIPANLKIDGKALEWDGQLQAYNKATDFFYTLANDDENLYLAVRATNPRTIEKIMHVGVKFTISPGAKKNINADGNVSVTYPVLSGRYTKAILVNAGDKANWSGMPPQRPGSLFTETLTRTDSSVDAANKALVMYANNIKITGAKILPDSLISIYNEEHIRVAGVFDSKGVYIYELAIPLKYLGLAAGVQKFTYNIRLKDYDSGSTFRQRDPATGRPQGEMIDADLDFEVVTEFWADYTLAKK